MEFFLEIIIDFLLPSVANPKVPTWIRVFLVTLVFVGVETVLVLVAIEAFSVGIISGIICCILSVAWLSLCAFVLYETIKLRNKHVN